ncbi:hypothetical protein FOL47_010319 [Perkinsus chesapeaki]|uniref:STI1/HOP DP domain-containing protein n=1 Tax=Perkinsus chesapeaki TaxID=330153 RepID=A0A7J6L3H8_PERCH|nr:hypothetical protein FOL47_010319 [Perkinsus chesapeaki]
MSYSTEDLPPPLEDYSEQCASLRKRIETFKKATSAQKVDIGEPDKTESKIVEENKSRRHEKEQEKTIKKGFLLGKSSSKKVKKDVVDLTHVGQKQQSYQEIAQSSDSLKLPQVQAPLIDSAKRLSADTNSWLSPELMRAVMANPSLAKGFADPRYQRVLRTMQEDPEQAKEEIANDKELADWLKAFSALMSRHFDKLASKCEVPKAKNTEPQSMVSEEVQAILQDPQIQKLLQYLQSNPQAKLDPRQLPPSVAIKVMRLVDNGIIKLHG